MKTMKLFVVLIVVAVASLLSVPVVQAATEGPQSVLTYSAPAKVKVDMESFDCKIASHKFDKATGVGTITFKGQLKEIRDDSFFYYREITNIVIPNSVTSIGMEAFRGCRSLKSITIGNSVKSIGLEAFRDCSSLKSITIGSSVKSIGYDAFRGCDAIKDVNVNITNLAEYCKGNAIDNIPGNKHFYIDNKEITELVIPNSVTAIRGCAFAYCSSLTSITIPNSVTSIGDYAFWGCSRLKSVKVANKYCYDYFKDKVANIAFYGANASDDGRCLIIGGKLERFSAKGVTEYTIPESVTSIGDYAFEDCRSLTSITIPNSVTEIGGRAFEGCSSLTSITIPDSVTSITIPHIEFCFDSYVFRGCYALKDVNVNITNLAEYCKGNVIDNIPGNKHLYIDNKEITELVIPNSVTSIGERAFKSCKSLTSITIPNSVTTIEDYAFNGCSSLTSITIPNSVTSIGRYAFYGCSSLTDVIVPERCVPFIDIDNVKRINGKDIIRDNGCVICDGVLLGVNSGVSSCSIPASVKSIVSTAFSGCENLRNVNVADLSLWLRSGIKLGKINLYHNGELVTNLVIPSGVTKIEDNQFAGCLYIKSVLLPNTVTSIGKCAFSGCSSLTSVTIPNSVTVIEDEAFRDCSSLTSVTIPNSVINICTQAFYGCSELNEVTIPASVKTLGKYVFGGYAGNLTVYMQGVNPPALVGQFFDWSSNFQHRTYIYDEYGDYDIKDIWGITLKLYVPKNALYNYKSADFWKDLEHYISTKN